MRPPSASRPTPRTGLALALGVAALVAAPAAARAQSAAVPVSATIGIPGIVTGQQNLAFTTVFPGVAKTVSPTTGGSAGATVGIFRVVGLRNAMMQLSFTLPAGNALRNGTNALTIDTWAGCSNTVNSAAGCTAFVPSSSGSTARLSNPATGFLGELWIRIGATVRPTPTQPAGTYTGTVTLSAVYTGL